MLAILACLFSVVLAGSLGSCGGGGLTPPRAVDVQWFVPAQAVSATAASGKGMTITCITTPTQASAATLSAAARQVYGNTTRVLLAAQGHSRSYVVVETPLPTLDPRLLFGRTSGVPCWTSPLQKVHRVSAGTQTSGVDPLSLDRLDQRIRLPVDARYGYIGSGEGGPHVVLLDTGVYAAHTQFGGRATFLANYIGDSINGDCHGHGTHTASLAGGTTLGTSKQVLIDGIKVLDCDGSGTDVSVALGVRTHTHSPRGPNCSSPRVGPTRGESLRLSAVGRVSLRGEHVAAGCDNRETGAFLLTVSRTLLLRD